jgi:hypothetical protein
MKTKLLTFTFAATFSAGLFSDRAGHERERENCGHNQGVQQRVRRDQ